MITPSTHKAGRPFRRFSAVVLTTIYLLMVMSPLASLAMYSKTVAHAVTGECSGDCDVCGCSLESRANHTCCCAKKKLNRKRTANQDCCTDKTDKHAVVGPVSQQKANAGRTETVYKCGCPCGTGKMLTLAGFGSNELIPTKTGEMPVPLSMATLFNAPPQFPASRHADPPDPPPRLLSFS